MIKQNTLTYAFNLKIPGRAVLLCVVLALIFLFSTKTLSAQEPPRREIDIDPFIQNLIADPSEEVDYSELYESLFALYADPLDINKATRDELAALMLLSETQLNSFLKYREQLGPLISLYELQAVPDFDLATIYRLLPFVTVHSRTLSLAESLKNPSQHFLIVRSGKLLEKQKGFLPADSGSNASRYNGKPLYGYLKYRNSRAGIYSYGFAMEKDAGEKWWHWNAKRQILGADFSSFHAQIMNQGRIKNLIIGDYQMQAGQGLVMAAGFSLGKGAEVISSTYRSTLGLKPYTSVQESNFFRGVAATFSLSKHFELTTFYSYAKRDATVNDAEDKNPQIASSLPVTGYHRTASEREKHNNLPEQNVGIHLLFKLPSKAGQIGFTMLNTSYDIKLQKRNAAYNRYEFVGKHNLVAGLHADYRWQNVHFFGETARSKSGGLGAIAGLIAALGKKFDISLLGRHYDRDFHTFYGNAIAEATRPINETGGYAGFRYAPNRRWKLSAYYDYFKFPWLKYLVDAPSKGYDCYFHVLWKPNKRFNAYALYHQKKKQRNAPADEGEEGLVSTVRKTATIHVEYEEPLRFALKTRLQSGNLAYLKISKSNGFTVLQDISWQFPRLELSARVAYFKTDDYDSRQYVYEKDMLYAFSIPAYYDAGTRHYLMARYAVSKNMKLWLRWSQTRYANLDKISSGLNEIQGDKRSELKAQVMYQF
ncbi:helix-hairpin-helix domain-containing protein [Dyadobacter fanqingshengii]|uniref:Helix-hairpin-helix domain-containing protein n=1 Tax=Dyadobacter fanqingshengii TaxID=2906443 RepID=A0A9X1TCW4_9BACT|nr:helix-hairpin-helix domain-containing protein [Dyadobacter fanqingshengii]MCF0043549.1 helix-hairpin-helix domain-containing protein [Dyadobacter fanqingshengii]USJ34832.1 helix-hairpin-helix domain-containing protein [Dyadobacter fanqingshengii]